MKKISILSIVLAASTVVSSVSALAVCRSTPIFDRNGSYATCLVTHEEMAGIYDNSFKTAEACRAHCSPVVEAPQTYAPGGHCTI